ncbi:hypothetical protein Tco_1078960 [Tanacetum coccineum]|uniref:Uncharacterized protein n=1 Tax=Tanacetum coccineum TaxID=301880 RepID=A0ABQ5HQI6_9ASTR
MSAKRKNGLGYGTQLNEMSNNSETDSEISLSVFDVRSSDEENTPANDRFSKVDGFHAVPPPITGNFLTPRADISFAEVCATRVSGYRRNRLRVYRWLTVLSDLQPTDTNRYEFDILLRNQQIRDHKERGNHINLDWIYTHNEEEERRFNTLLIRDYSGRALELSTYCTCRAVSTVEI